MEEKNHLILENRYIIYPKGYHLGNLGMIYGWGKDFFGEIGLHSE